MVSRLFTGLFGAAGAVGFAQFPAFYQQYLQRLGGRRDQAWYDLERLKQDAEELGYTLRDYVAELIGLGNEAASQTAQREMERMENAQSLSQAYEQLKLATPLDRPYAFVRNFDPEVARDTLQAFQPALPVTPETVIYGGVGLLLGIGLLMLLENGSRKTVGRFRKPKASSATPTNPTATKPDPGSSHE